MGGIMNYWSRDRVSPRDVGSGGGYPIVLVFPKNINRYRCNSNHSKLDFYSMSCDRSENPNQCDLVKGIPIHYCESCK